MQKATLETQERAKAAERTTEQIMSLKQGKETRDKGVLILGSTVPPLQPFQCHLERWKARSVAHTQPRLPLCQILPAWRRPRAGHLYQGQMVHTGTHGYSTCNEDLPLNWLRLTRVWHTWRAAHQLLQVSVSPPRLQRKDVPSEWLQVSCWGLQPFIRTKWANTNCKTPLRHSSSQHLPG